MLLFFPYLHARLPLYLQVRQWRTLQPSKSSSPPSWGQATRWSAAKSCAPSRWSGLGKRLTSSCWSGLCSLWLSWLSVCGRNRHLFTSFSSNCLRPSSSSSPTSHTRQSERSKLCWRRVVRRPSISPLWTASTGSSCTADCCLKSLVMEDWWNNCCMS